MMQLFTWLLYFVYLSGALAIGGELYLKLQARSKDGWRYQWLVEASWESIFTLFVCAVMGLMRPSESSKMLAYIEEIGEEPTAAGSSSAAYGTQNNTQEGGQNNKQEEIEMQQITKQSKGGKRSLERQRLD